MKNLLLPFRWKFIGWFLTLCGTFLAVLYVEFNFKFKMPVFEVYSSFLRTRTMVTKTTNFADELILILLITGLGLVVFSKEKVESENLDSIRVAAFARALLTNIVFLLLSVIFIYGMGFITALVFNQISFSLFYIVFFFFLKRKKMKFWFTGITLVCNDKCRRLYF